MSEFVIKSIDRSELPEAYRKEFDLNARPIAGAAEAALSLGTSIPTGLVGGLGFAGGHALNLPSYALGGEGIVDPEHIFEYLSGLAYQPRTRTGQNTVRRIGELLNAPGEALGEGVMRGAEAIGSAGRHPTEIAALATAARLAPDVLLNLLGFRGARRIVGRGSPVRVPPSVPISPIKPRFFSQAQTVGQGVIKPDWLSKAMDKAELSSELRSAIEKGYARELPKELLAELDQLPPTLRNQIETRYGGIPRGDAPELGPSGVGPTKNFPLGESADEVLRNKKTIAQLAEEFLKQLSPESVEAGKLITTEGRIDKHIIQPRLETKVPPKDALRQYDIAELIRLSKLGEE